jgi:hypothetical protein
MGKGDLSTFCTTVANVEGLNLKSLGPQGTLVATVIPMRPGLVETNGFQRRYPIDVYGIEITYVQNGRRITQRTGTEFQYLVQQ